MTVTAVDLAVLGKPAAHGDILTVDGSVDCEILIGGTAFVSHFIIIVV